MDFVVLGFGIGALAVLLGLTARDLGPFARRIPRDGAIPWADVAQRAAWGRACRAGGLTLALAGGALCVLTGIALLFQASDSLGMGIVVGGIAVAVLGIAAWAALYIWRPPFIANATFGATRSNRPPRSGRSSGMRDTNGERRRSRSSAADRPPGEAKSSSDGGRRRPDARGRGPEAQSGARPRQATPPEGPRLGALTVDAMGGMRRATLPSRDAEQPDASGPGAEPDRASQRRGQPGPTDQPRRSNRGSRTG